jgi:hypothetical protein
VHRLDEKASPIVGIAVVSVEAAEPGRAEPEIETSLVAPYGIAAGPMYTSTPVIRVISGK